MLKRILHENIDEDEVGNGKEKDRKDKQTNKYANQCAYKSSKN